MITIQHTKEGLSFAYLRAVVAKARHNFIEGRVHDYGFDGTIKQVIKDGSRHIESGFGLDFQAKATCDWSRVESGIVYDLEAQTYNDFVARANRAGAYPCILIVMCLCPNENDWLTVSSEQLVLKNCAYWLNLRGETTTNSSTKRITLPESNLFSPLTLGSLLTNVESGRDL